MRCMNFLTDNFKVPSRTAGPAIRKLLKLASVLLLAAASSACVETRPRVVAEEALPREPLASSAAPRIALVLSSGGLRGLAHLGVLRALEAHGLKPDLVVGSSVGALIGASHAAGLSGSVWIDRPLPPMLDPFGSWLVTPGERSRAFESFVAEILGGRRIEQLPVRFVAVATERRDGCIVLFGEGDAARAVSASSALPGALAPVSIRGQTFSDGGLAAPLPVRVARLLGARYVIAVDTTFHAEPVVPEGLIDSVFHAGMVMSRNLAMPDRLDADVLIEPQLPPVAEVTLDNRAALIAAGERAALAQMGRLKALFERASQSAQADLLKPSFQATAQGRAAAAVLPLCKPGGMGGAGSVARAG